MFTLQTEIMRHTVNLAKEMASGDLFKSRKKLDEYPLRGDPNVFDHIMRSEPFRTGCGATRSMTPRTIRGAGPPTSLIVPSDGCVTRINGHEKIPTTSTTP